MPETCTACDRSEQAFRTLADHGERQTGLRRDVLKALHHAERPIGAYDLYNQLHGQGRASAPPAVYRVLDFLVEQGLVHKLPTLSAFAACKAQPHENDACFLICQSCGHADEIETPALQQLRDLARSGGFRARQVSIEITGLCAECQPA